MPFDGCEVFPHYPAPTDRGNPPRPPLLSFGPTSKYYPGSTPTCRLRSALLATPPLRGSVRTEDRGSSMVPETADQPRRQSADTDTGAQRARLRAPTPGALPPCSSEDGQRAVLQPSLEAVPKDGPSALREHVWPPPTTTRSCRPRERTPRKPAGVRPDVRTGPSGEVLVRAPKSNERPRRPRRLLAPRDERLSCRCRVPARAAPPRRPKPTPRCRCAPSDAVRVDPEGPPRCARPPEGERAPTSESRAAPSGRLPPRRTPKSLPQAPGQPLGRGAS
jgi:hypothetical protein